MASVRLENVTKTFREVVALRDLSLDIKDGEFFTILGPPGAGKTTTLRTIIGLETPDRGSVYVDEECVDAVYPGDRDIAIVFQNLALYPDKTVFKNLAFPLKQRKVPRAEIKERVGSTARLLQIEHLLGRKPGKLSGGERQRVALGRALVREPRVFLLDEPISALDALLRLEMRTELKRLQQELGRTLVYVTHDQVEAMSMSNSIAVLRLGELQQVAPPEEIYNRPANRFVATTIGSPPMNFIPATISRASGRLAAVSGDFEISMGAPEAGADLAGGEACFVGVRPEDVQIVPDGDGIPAMVFVTEPLGAEKVVDLQLGDQIVKALTAPELAVSEQQAVNVRFDPRRLHLFDADGNAIASAAGEDLFTFEPAARR